jgi:hypothetical protein
MSLFPTIYEQVKNLLKHDLPSIHEGSLNRVVHLVLGIIKGKSASPARIAQAIEELGLRDAKASSIERCIRRIENDPQVENAIYLHPFVRERLLFGRPRELILAIDPTTQEDRVVMLTVSIWYRGRSLPLTWDIWAGNTPLEGDGFWSRVETLLNTIAEVLPKHIPVTWLADRAFGSPAFTDLLTARGWHYVVRAQGTTRCQDKRGAERQIQHLIYLRGQRAKMRGLAFKKYRWRPVSIVVHWGRRHEEALCLISDLRPGWYLIHLYRRRYSIEATFRDYKSSGWQWEQGQVVDLEHIKHLLTCMALATWISICVGSQVAQELLSHPPTGRRRTIPWEGKRSLFTLGLQRLNKLFIRPCIMLLHWQLTDWDAPNWQSQIYFHHVHAFIFGANNMSQLR